MAYAVEVTLSTGNKVSLNYQSEEMSVSITYRLEREDHDVLAVVNTKVKELVMAHALAWKRVKGESEDEPASEKGEEAEVASALQDEAATSARKRATPAQVQLLRALSQQAGWSEERLQTWLQSSYGCEAPETLSYEQAAALLVVLGGAERERFNRERSQSQANDSQSEESISSTTMC